MKHNRSILEQLAGLGVALENISESPKMTIKIRSIDREPELQIKKKTTKPYFRMKEKW